MQMMNRRRSYLSWWPSALMTLALASCLPADFEDYQRLAPVRVHSMPTNALKQQDYGSVLATMRTGERQGEASYIVASAGRGSALSIIRAWDGDSPSEDKVARCARVGECKEGEQDLGGVLVPFELWGRGGADERTNCVFAPVNYKASDGQQSAQGWVACESSKSAQQFPMPLGVPLATGESLHFSGFGLPPGHPLGVVLFGAHAQPDKDKGSGGRRDGGLYRLPDRYEFAADMLAPRPFKLRDPSVRSAEGGFFTDDPERGDLGRELVGTITRDGELLIAVSQPSKQRVIVAAFDPRLAGAVEQRFVTRACVASPERDLRGFGERLAFGDVTGDDQPELFVGSDPLLGVEVGKQALYMFPGGGLPPASAAAEACPAWNAQAVAVRCRDQDGLRCADSAFGSAIAVGDFDGDERGDLLVGAPSTMVDGAVAGAVWLVPGARDGLDFQRSATVASPKPNARFGTAVAALRSEGRRSEPVVGAPGLNQLFVYMCTPLELSSEHGNFCLPLPARSRAF
jgi:hypothetical protein